MSEKIEKTIENCRICGSTALLLLPVPGKPYWLCEGCGTVFLDPSRFLSREAERERYRKHENNLEDSGYRRYLETFLDEIMNDPRVNPDAIERVFDFGSGPEPALVKLLRQRGVTAAGWDPFFEPEGKVFPEGADLVTCLEVAEHFREPDRGFRGLAECARPGAWIAVATHPVDGDRTILERDFPAWWYRQDPTHVTFYSRESLVLAGEKAGLRYIGPCGPYTFLFQREFGE